MVSLSTLLLVSCAGLVEAMSWSVQHYDIATCWACTGLIGMETRWEKGHHDSSDFCSVKNQPALGSIAVCLDHMPNPEHTKQRYVESCMEDYEIELTLDELVQAGENATQYLVFNPSKTIEGWNKSMPAFVPIGFSQDDYDMAYKSSLGRWINMDWSMWYGIALFGYWFVIMFVAGLYNALFFVAPGFVKRLQNPAINWWRKHVTLPALFSEQHVNPTLRWKFFAWVVPTRWEAVMVGIYLGLVIVFNAEGYHAYDKNIYWHNRSQMMGKLMAQRSGIASMFMIPQLILFAGRNNFMQWVTRWSYSRFVYIHKWIARVCVILVGVHAIGYTCRTGSFNSKAYKEWMTEGWFIWGIVSTVVGFVMLVQALYFIRHLNYEFFLLCHIIFAVFFIVGGWIHCAYQGYELWFYAAIAVWCFDRAVRLARLALFGVRKANVQLVGDTLRVTVERPSYWKPFPGCHAFIHFIRPSIFWQSHPFTIVEDAAEADGSGTITLYLKVKGGVTHGLYKYLSQCPGNAAKIPVSIEGPYGNRKPLDRYDTAVFVAGGHGIPGLYAQARDIISKASKTKVKFYWVIRNYQAIEWFYPELQKFNNDKLDTVVFVSQPVELVTPIASETSSTDEKKSDEEKTVDYLEALKQKFTHIDFREGRPSCDALVASEIAESEGTIAFTTCGAGTLVDSTRRAVAQHFDSSKHRVDYFEQAQIW
ncbi:ferric/cupric reductase transmembrane component 2 [Diutina catenulata]